MCKKRVRQDREFKICDYGLSCRKPVRLVGKEQECDAVSISLFNRDDAHAEEENASANNSEGLVDRWVSSTHSRQKKWQSPKRDE